MLPNNITLFMIDRHMNDMSLETEIEFIFFCFSPRDIDPFQGA